MKRSTLLAWAPELPAVSDQGLFLGPRRPLPRREAVLEAHCYAALRSASRSAVVQSVLRQAEGLRLLSEEPLVWEQVKQAWGPAKLVSPRRSVLSGGAPKPVLSALVLGLPPLAPVLKQRRALPLCRRRFREEVFEPRKRPLGFAPFLKRSRKKGVGEDT